MNKLKEFLNPVQQEAISDYNFIDNDELSPDRIRPRDYIKFMYRYNYQFMEGGIVTNTDEFPIIKLKAYEKGRKFYNLDLTKVFVFHKKNVNGVSRRNFFEELLKNLESGKLKTKK